MKQRFSYLDLKIVSNEVSTDLQNCRLQNVYSLESSNRHFLFKFDTGSGEVGKKFLIVDPGLRYHITKYQHQPTPQPTYFVQKLRKFLKNRRLNGVFVTPNSRTVVFSFSDSQVFLVLEFFAGGNIIVLNNEHKIVSLFRVIRDEKSPYELGKHYPLNFETGVQPEPTDEEIRACALKDKLAKSLNSIVYDPSTSLLEYCLRSHNLDPKAKLTESDLESKFADIKAAIQMALQKAHELFNASGITGYILRDSKNTALEFEPFKEYFELVCKDEHIESHEGYNKTIDEYFGAILSDKQVNRVEQLHQIADSRLEAARAEKQNRVQSLLSQKEENEKCGTLLQNYSDLVGKAIDAVNALVQQGTDWGDIKKLLDMEKDKQNTVAEVIDSLQLANNQITLLLEDTKVRVDLDKSAFANARNYFDIRKSLNNKIDKTEQHSKRALKSAETRIKADLQSNLKKHEKQGALDKLHVIRQVYWFEKFYWFFSSLGQLCIAGKDEFQNELILNKYFQNTDLLVGSDAFGSPLVLIKNPNGEEIGPQTLLQACGFCVACSKNWDSKSKAPAYFLTRNQVPKEIKGEAVTLKDLALIRNKNKIQPAPIELAAALLWADLPLASDVKEDDSGDSESEEEFPDVEFQSDEEFPDLEFNSASEDDNASDGSAEPEPYSRSVSPQPTTTLSVPSSPTQTAKEPSPQPEIPDVSPLNTPLPTDSEAQGDIDESLMLSGSDKEPVKQLTNDQKPKNASKSKLKVRGQKKKLLKYKNQDEEDKQLMMERLGTLKGISKQQAPDTGKNNNSKQSKGKQERPQRAKIDLDSPVEPMDIPEFSTKYKPQTQPMLMFAPWSSVQKCEFKLKITAGSTKRGKATTEILKVILNTGLKPALDEQKSQLAAIKPADVQNSIPVAKLGLPKSK